MSNQLDNLRKVATEVAGVLRDYDESLDPDHSLLQRLAYKLDKAAMPVDPFNWNYGNGNHRRKKDGNAHGTSSHYTAG